MLRFKQNLQSPKKYSPKKVRTQYMEINMKFVPMLLENIFNLEAPPTKTE